MQSIVQSTVANLVLGNRRGHVATVRSDNARIDDLLRLRLFFKAYWQSAISRKAGKPCPRPAAERLIRQLERQRSSMHRVGSASSAPWRPVGSHASGTRS